MPVVTCPACSSRLRLPEQAGIKRVKCPKCAAPFAVPAPDEPKDDPEEVGIVEQPSVAPARKKRARDEDFEEVPDTPDTEEAPEPSDEEEAPRKKKKKKKKRRRPVPDDGEPDYSWMWWAFGGGGIGLVMLFFLGLAIFPAMDNPVRWIAIYMVIAVPLTTVLFFVALFISSVTVGAVEIGEIHVAVVKSFFLSVAVNLVSLVPCGGYLALGVWLIGLILLFRLDMWEARVIIFINWVLNFGLRWALLAALLAAMTHPGPGGLGGRQPPNRKAPGQNAVWDEDDVEGLGGAVEYDQARPDDGIVASISFQGAPRIGDAEMAHMKDFPGLTRLDLKGTNVTDAGLAQLAECKNLQRLTLTGTGVTDVGVQNLQRALPRLRIVR